MACSWQQDETTTASIHGPQKTKQVPFKSCMLIVKNLHLLMNGFFKIVESG